MLKNISIGTRLAIGFMTLTLITLLLGIVGFVYIEFVGNSGKRVGEQLAPLGDATMEINISVYRAHLYLEQNLAGDHRNPDKEIWASFDRAGWFIQAVLKGGKNEEGVFYPSQDPKVREQTEILKEKLNGLIETSKKRYSIQTNSKTSSNADEAFDRHYDSLQENIEPVLKKALSDNNISAVYSVGEVKYLLAYGHLLFEEYISGDTSKSVTDIIDHFRQAKALLEKNLAKSTEESHKQLLSQMDSFIQATEERNHDYLTTNQKIKESFESFHKDFLQFATIASDMEDRVKAEMQQGLHQVETDTNTAKLIILTVALAAIFLGVFLSVIITRSIIIPLNHSVQFVSDLAKGKLSIITHIHQSDEVGNLIKALNDMSVNLIKTILYVLDAIYELSDNAKHLSTEVGDITQGLNDQFSQVEKTAQTSSGISNIIDEVVDNTQNAARAATHASKVAAEGKQAGTETVAEIHEIVTSVKDSMLISNSLQENSKKISSIVNSIKDITEQTNLLALNAAIESARAGEQGRGFSVVADEVRKLASKTAQSTQEIIKIVDKIQRDTNSSVTSMNAVSEQTTEGARSVEKTVVTLENIVQASDQCLAMIDKITESMNRQSKAVSEISQGMSQISGVAQGSKNSIAHINSAISRLVTLSDGLTHAVKWFKLDNQIDLKNIDKHPNR